MRAVRKKIVTDENAQPIAVQIDYADWVEIELALAPLFAQPEGTHPLGSGEVENAPLAGSILSQGDLESPLDETWGGSPTAPGIHR